MQILKLVPGGLAEWKKPHPCGGKMLKILRVGSVCRVACVKCGREVEVDRVKLETAIRRLLPGEEKP